MGEKWERILSKAIGVNAIEINSALVSAQNRRRLYWTNIGQEPSGLFGDLESVIKQPKDKGIMLKDILEDNVDEKYYISETMINRILRTNKGEICFTTDENALYLTAGYFKQGRDNQYIVHNMQPRSGDPTKVGTGHLTRNDGKTYCLDTGNTNAVEVIGMDFRYDEGFRQRGGGKSPTLTLGSDNGISGNALAKIGSRIRRLTPTECERLQTVNDGYTKGVSDTQRYRMLGNGWTVDVIVHILNHLKI
jgi:DNA (cytosine-5)-methyltransferase 3A